MSSSHENHGSNGATMRGFRCARCGAPEEYDATCGAMRCAHCGNLHPVAGARDPAPPHDLAEGEGQAPHGFGASVGVHHCRDCGAQVAFPAPVTATRCTFCGSAKVLDEPESPGLLRPEWLLPFSIDRRQAAAHFDRWLRRRWLRPSDLVHRATVAEVAGVYVPFFSYDADVRSRWRAERGHHHDVEEEYEILEAGKLRPQRRTVRHTRWQTASGQRHDRHDDVLVCASLALPRDLSVHLLGLSTKHGLRPWAPGYLAGWRAESAAVAVAPCWDEARARIETQQEARCARDVGGDTHRGLVADHQFGRVTFQHVLLPIWIAAYRYRGRVYRFLVNGQTGQVTGKAPWSVPKVTALIAFLVAVAVTLFLVLRKG